MNVVYRSLGYLKNMYNQINPATLTGAIDIVVVEHEDGSYYASPFHVRFGKLGVLRAKEKLVKITVNDERIRDLHMKLGDQGEAFFVEEIAEEEDETIPPRLITSPLPSRPDTPTDKGKEKLKIVVNGVNDDSANALGLDESGKRKRRKKRKKRAAAAQSSDEKVETGLNQSISDEDDKVFCTILKDEKLAEVKETYRRISDSSEGKLSDSNQRPIHGFLSDSEITSPQAQLLKEENTITPFSDSETSIHHSKSGSMMWGWGQLPKANEPGQDSSSDDSVTPTPKKTTDVTDEAMFRTIVSQSDVKLIDTTETEDKENEGSTSSSRPTTGGSSKAAPNGLYLDDVLCLNPSEANLYLQKPSTKSGSRETPVGGGSSERAASPSGGSDIDSGTDSQTHEDNTSETVTSSTPEVKISLCGFASGSHAVDNDKFVEKEVNFETFLQNPASILGDPNLVFKLGEQYMNWQAAAPALIAMVVYKQQLTKECIDRFVQAAQPQQSTGIVGWFWRKPKPTAPTETPPRGDEAKASPNNVVAVVPSKTTTPQPQPTIDPLSATNRTRKTTDPKTDEAESEIAEILHNVEMKRSHSEQSIYSAHVNQFVFSSTTTITGGKMMRKTTRLNSEQLSSLGLKEGPNKIVFSVTTQYQGTSRCQATIYLWKWDDKIVVSDIDGTITKSDVFGQILPVVGKDWTHTGIAQLYQNIGRNGYKFMYLSARAIGQASMTKNYLNWVDQQGVCLPPGPLFLSPTSLMVAFRREVIEKKPEKFKIDCLKDIKALFPSNPFSAGFGNKTSDVMSYTAVGIPSNRMFTINHKGELRQEGMQTYTTSYNDLGEIVDHFFPPRDQHQDLEYSSPSYSDFRNGYKFMYLSARAIGQASMTKNYLNWVDQQGVCLPPGPLFLSPTSLMVAFRREVIEKKPEKFKIDCLKDIKALFPSNPFSAGFGNKTSDVMSYTAVGIPSNRMFTINHKGELRQEGMQTYTTSYNDLGEIVDHFFPPRDQHQDLEYSSPSYSDFRYWRDDVMTMVDELDDFRLT